MNKYMHTYMQLILVINDNLNIKNNKLKELMNSNQILFKLI